MRHVDFLLTAYSKHDIVQFVKRNRYWRCSKSTRTTQTYRLRSRPKNVYSEGIFVPAAATPKVDDSAQRIALPEQIIE